MHGSGQRRTRIVVVGGGAAGSIVAGELARIDAPVDIEVFEPRGDIGPGLAYSTPDPRHVVNVPAGRLSAVSDDPDHLVRWLEARGEDARAEAFPQRRVYGRYLRELFAARVAAATAAKVNVHERAATAADLRDADAAVLALGNVQAPPAVPLPDEPRCFASPWEPGALDPAGLPDASRILIVGTGLTAVDAALSLADAAPGATIHAVSRNGHLPFTHVPGPLQPPAPVDGFPTDATTLDALRAAWDRHLAAATASGFDWRAAVDGVRPITQQLWRSLDVESQATFLRECRRWWEARRNRAAPSVGTRLEDLVDEGRLVVAGGGVSGRFAEPWDRIISCTGPTSDIRRTTNALLRDLLEDGIAAADVHHLGIRTTPDGALLDAAGTPSDRLYTLGWLRRGELWETLAIPEIRVQARAIAERLSA